MARNKTTNSSGFRIGTSGYSYPWNKGKPTPFQWYLSQGFNSVEINASFYRFPSSDWIRLWEEFSPDNFDFSIKVHRSITHFVRLKGEKALDLWSGFSAPLFKEKKLDRKISFFLFQMPADFSPAEDNIRSLQTFFQNAGLGNRAAIEFRHKKWWDKIEVCKKLGAVFCSVDAPQLPREIVALNNAIYLRLHGREKWYASIYSEEDLDEICSKLERLSPKAAKGTFVYLNNDHGMLPNGKYLLHTLGISTECEDIQVKL